MDLNIENYTHTELKQKEQLFDLFHAEGNRIFAESTRGREFIISDGALRNYTELRYYLGFWDGQFVGGSSSYYGPLTFENEQIVLGIVSGTFVIEKYRKRGFGLALTDYARGYLNGTSDLIFGYGKPGRRDNFVDIPYYVYKGASGRYYLETDGHIAEGRRPDIFHKIVGGSLLVLENGRK